MTLDAFLSFSAALCLFCYWLHNLPEVFALLVEYEMDKSLTHEQARVRCGWWRLGSLFAALVNALLAVAT